MKSLPGDTPFATPYSSTATYPDSYKAVPWGISPHIIHFLHKLKAEDNLTIAIPEWKPQLKNLTGRQGTIQCHLMLSKQLHACGLPQPPVVHSSIESIEEYIKNNPLPIVVKTPFSSSGRGILWLRKEVLTNAERNWIKGALHRQGFICLEKGLDKTLDFAMEFYSDGRGTVRYEGLSVFRTEDKGAYCGNLLASQEILHQELGKHIDKALLEQTKEAVINSLQAVYSKTYEGYLGVDMMLYQKNGQTAIHPCVEVNMRFTMGLVALKLFDRYISPSATGSFHITFEKTPGAALETHHKTQAEHPLQISDGRIEKGYLSLCPVTHQTFYRAYLNIGNSNE